MHATHVTTARVMPGAPVLVVEDDRATRMAMAALLKHQGLAVTAVGGVAAAIEALDRAGGNFAFLLVDLMLPDGNGTEVLRHAQAIGCTARTYVLTGMVDPPDVRAAQSLHPDAILTKPVEFADVINLMTESAPGLMLREPTETVPAHAALATMGTPWMADA